MEKKKAPENIGRDRRPQSFIPPSEQEIKAKQALQVLVDFGIQLKRLGDVASSKDSRLTDSLAKFREDIDTVLDNYNENMGLTVNELSSLLEKLADIPESIGKMLEEEEGAMDRINRSLAKLNDTVAGYGTSANTHVGRMAKLEDTLTTGVAEIKRLLSEAETPLGRSNVGEKNHLTRPAAAMQANNERATVIKLEAIKQQLDEMPIPQIATRLEALQSAIKQRNGDIAGLLRGNNEALTAAIVKSIRTVLVEEPEMGGKTREANQSADEKIRELEEKLAEAEKEKQLRPTRATIRIDRSGEDKLRAEIEKLNIKIKELESRVTDDAEDAKTGLITENKRLLAELAAKEKVNSRLQAKVTELQQQINSITKEKEELKKTSEQLFATLSSKGDLSKDLKTKEREVKACYEEKTKLQGEKDSLAVQLEQVCATRDRTVESLNNKIRELKETLKKRKDDEDSDEESSVLTKKKRRDDDDVGNVEPVQSTSTKKKNTVPDGTAGGKKRDADSSDDAEPVQSTSIKKKNTVPDGTAGGKKRDADPSDVANVEPKKKTLEPPTRKRIFGTVERKKTTEPPLEESETKTKPEETGKAKKFWSGVKEKVQQDDLSKSSSKKNRRQRPIDDE